MNERELRQLILESGLESMSAALLSSVRPAIRLRVETGAGSPAAFFTRLGGSPSLPSSLEWPVNDEGPLYFVAQLQLSEFAGFEAASVLPPRGRLYFFCDLKGLPSGWRREESASWRILYSPDETASVSEIPAPQPADSEELLQCCRVWLHHDLTIPGTRSIELSTLPEMDEETWEKYLTLLDSLTERRAGPAHRILGHPDPIQGCMQRIAQFVSHEADLPTGCYNFYDHPRAAELMPGAHDWILLLQIDSDQRLSKLYFGDNGLLYFWIRRQDLAALRFDRAWFFMQCH